MNNALCYNTPVEEFTTYYPTAELPFKSGKMETQLPKNIAVIRAVAAAVFTALSAIKYSATFFFWPAIVASAFCSVWTIYSHIYSKDPLLEAFYVICGGREKFEQLPDIQLDPAAGEKLSEAIEKLAWNKLENPIAKTKTSDGRNVLVIKAVTRNEEERGFSRSRIRATLAFVEKYGPYDDHGTEAPDLIRSVFHAISRPFCGNSFGREMYTKSWGFGDASLISTCQIYSSITADMANDFFAQIND